MIPAILRITPTLVLPVKKSKSLTWLRTFQQQAFEASFNPEDLEEARRWHAAFAESSLPRGQISYSRSSGPGGQHVNKTETKATTVWTVDELSRGLPKLVRDALRTSKYYSRRNDSISIQAQTQRSRAQNAEENQAKLAEEIQTIYRKQVPGITSDKKIKKHEALERSFRESRLSSKKHTSSKKASRKGRDTG